MRRYGIHLADAPTEFTANERTYVMHRRFLLLLVPVILLSVAPAAGQDLEELLTQVGEEYAVAYTEPLIHAFGANQNSGLYHTAHIPRSSLTFSIGLKVQGTYLDEGDQDFQKVLRDVDLHDYFPDEFQPGETGDIVLAGPTVFGSPDEMGTATAYMNGVPVYQVETIEGLIDTRWAPMAAPEFTLGGIAGLKGTLRWLPEIDLDNYGKSKYLGYGLQWSPNFLLGPTFPVDVMVGFFTQEIDLGTIVQTDASSYFVAASKSFGRATLYGGFSKEESTMTVDYTEEGSDTRVNFEMDGKMTSRATVGATLNLGAKLNLEMGVGKMVVYNVGLLFGM
jgi:hypothetical protein